jgi:hypothetical protein
MFVKKNEEPEEVNEYCKRMFEFDVIKVKKFKYVL